MNKIIKWNKLIGDSSQKIVYRCELENGLTCIILDFKNITKKSDECFVVDDLNINDQYDIFILMNNFLFNISQTECNVPEIYDCNNLLKQIMIEDAGEQNLCQYGYNYNIYVKLVEWLYQLSYSYASEHTNNPICKRFYEIDAMRQEINEYYDNGGSTIVGYDELLKSIAIIPYTICHRDFQTYNIIISSKIGKPQVIDVQDLCVGPLTLDLATILYDAKVKVPNDDIIKLINLFAKNTSYNSDQIFMWTRQCAVIRLVHSAGRHLKYYKENGKINHKQRVILSLNYIMDQFSDIVQINENDLHTIF